MAKEPRTFDSLLNFRDVATIAPRIKPGLLYRSARPDNTSPVDRDLLVSHYKLKTVLDLRSKTEHIEADKKHSAALDAATRAVSLNPNHEPVQEQRIPGLKYELVNLNGKGFERNLVWKLTWSQLAQLTYNMTMGYRLEGISILGRNVLKPLGLKGLARETLLHSGPEIKQVFDLLAHRENWPVLVHCTQGKDRTGMIVLLLLGLCGEAEDKITEDYILSEEELAPEHEERMKEIRSIGLDEDFAKCPKDFVAETMKFIRGEYGSTEQYLTHIGVREAQQGKIKEILRA